MKKQNGFSLLELLLVAVIIALLCYIATKVYFRGPVIDEKTQKALSEEGIDTTNYPGLIDTARDKVNKANKKIKVREEYLQEIE